MMPITYWTELRLDLYGRGVLHAVEVDGCVYNRCGVLLYDV